MSSSGRWTSLRPFVLIFLFSSCFLLLVFTYFKHEKLRAFVASVETSRLSCPAGGAVNCSLTAEDADTVLLIWTWPFGDRFDLSCSSFSVTGCRLTDDRSLFQQADAILFHHRDIHLADIPTEPRPCFQKWVWLNMESPANVAPIPELNDLFDLTCSYRLDSNVPVPYGYLVPVTSEDGTFKVPEKQLLVCWVVSNWNTRHRRVQFYNELKKHVQVSVFGGAFGRRLSDGEFKKTMSGCKFYLSFENSEHTDYITEKLYRPMMLGSVPVVLGPPRRNYEDHVPADAFIHVDDFSSAKHLAERLRQLDHDDHEYRSFFNWTERFRVHLSWFGPEHVCKTCRYLQTHRGQRVCPRLNKWFWS